MIRGCQGQGLGEDLDSKNILGNIWCNRIALYYDCGGGYLPVYILQTLLYCTFRINEYTHTCTHIRSKFKDKIINLSQAL